MCTPQAMSPKAWAVDVPLESNGLKKGRLNPLPGQQVGGYTMTAEENKVIK